MVEITEISSSVTKQTNCLVHLLFSSHDGNSVFFHKLRGGPEKNLPESNLFISLPWDAVKTLSQIFLLYNLVCSPSFSSHNSEELYKNTWASFLSKKRIISVTHFETSHGVLGYLEHRPHALSSWEKNYFTLSVNCKCKLTFKNNSYSNPSN